MSSVAIVGRGSQSKRIQNILKSLNHTYYIYVLKNGIHDKNEFEILKKHKIIFICSPNHTHFFYIKSLYKGRYIFCEKPPVSKKNELSFLNKIGSNKIFYNYNLRRSYLSEIFRDINKFNLGQLLYGNIVISHGLASKSEYKDSWRSNKNKAPKGVYEIVSVHGIDLINYHFDVDNIGKPSLKNFSGIGNSFDTSFVKLKLKNGGNINIFTTYYGPFESNWHMVFSNGLIKKENSKVSVLGPSKNLNSKGFFIPPKIINRKIISDESDYKKSLTKSVEYFLKICKSNKQFTKRETRCSLESNKLIL